MIRHFTIKNINDVKVLNELSLKLNSLGEVAHIKIKEEAIEFDSIDIMGIVTIVETIDPTLKIQEIIDEQETELKKEAEPKEYFFLFENINKDEMEQVLEVLSSYASYTDVSLNRQNKLLKLTTNDHYVLARLKRIVSKISPDIDIINYNRPFQGEDFFNRTFSRYFVMVLVGALAFGIAIVTRREPNIITWFAWLVTLVVLLSRLLENAWIDIRRKRYFTEDNLMIVSSFLGWVFGFHYEMVLVVIIYLAAKELLINLGTWVINDIDKKLEAIEFGNVETAQGIERVPLSSIDIGDVVVVNENETINFDCELLDDKAFVNSYAVDGDDNDKLIKANTPIRAGCTNLQGTIRVKVKKIYQSSALNLVASRATSYAMNESRMFKFMQLFAKVYTIVLIVLAAIMIILGGGFHLLDEPYTYIGIILLSISSNATYVQAISYSSLGVIANALTKNIVIKNANSIYRLHSCNVIIYDRVDNQPVGLDEMELIEYLHSLNKIMVIFNDGPQDLLAGKYQVRNNNSTEEKLQVITEYQKHNAVCYIGDSTKDIILLQSANVGISRGGILAKRVIRNSDIVLKDSSKKTMENAFRVSQRYRYVIYQYGFLGLVGVLAIFVMAVANIIPWVLAVLIDVAISGAVILINKRIVNFS